MRRNFGRRRGFSLIELLIVVAIIAALVGVAVPFFQDNLSEAQVTKAKQDLEIIKKALSLYDAREPRALTGTSLDPLLGRYMQELPKDPWGNPYLFDGRVGFLASYGADALPLGSGGDQDIFVYTRPPVMITRVQYQGSWGRPKPMQGNKHSTGNKFILTLSKPVEEVTPADLTDDVVLLRDVNVIDNSSRATGCDGGENDNYPASACMQLSEAPFQSGTWESAAETSAAVDALHKPDGGVLVINCRVGNLAAADQAVTPTMAIDFLQDTSGNTNESAVVSITETYYAEPPSANAPVSPMDTSVYGTDAYTEYERPPVCAELVNGQRRGVRIEKY